MRLDYLDNSSASVPGMKWIELQSTIEMKYSHASAMHLHVGINSKGL